jgi:hypothetical protein
VPFARPLVFFGADVFSDRQLALEMESRARKIPSTKLVAVGSPIHSRDVRQCRGGGVDVPWRITVYLGHPSGSTPEWVKGPPIASRRCRSVSGFGGTCAKRNPAHARRKKPRPWVI